jgi:hypothetical protein
MTRVSLALGPTPMLSTMSAVSASSAMWAAAGTCFAGAWTPKTVRLRTTTPPTFVSAKVTMYGARAFAPQAIGLPASIMLFALWVKAVRAAQRRSATPTL